MSLEPRKFDAIVVGAGAIGAACALRLAQTKPQSKIALIERNKRLSASLGENMRVWALGGVACNVLREAQVFSKLPEQASHAYSRMSVWDENSHGELFFDANDLGQQELGFMVDADYVTAQLQSALGDHPNITVLFEVQIESIENAATKASLQTSAGRLDTDLVIAADGGNSWLRRQAKILALAQPYDQKGVVAKIKTAKSHQDTAWQRFLQTGPVAVLPLAEGYSSIVWSAQTDQSEELIECSDQDFEIRLAQALDHRLGDVSLSSQRLAFPLVSRKAEQYYLDRLVLIGDAAHSIHPLAGQGANLGFRDVQALVEILLDADDMGESARLARYQRLRRPDNLLTDGMMTSLHHVFSFESSMFSIVRGEGMNWISDNQALKNLLAKQAMGLSA